MPRHAVAAFILLLLLAVVALAVDYTVTIQREIRAVAVFTHGGRPALFHSIVVTAVWSAGGILQQQVPHAVATVSVYTHGGRDTPTVHEVNVVAVWSSGGLAFRLNYTLPVRADAAWRCWAAWPRFTLCVSIDGMGSVKVNGSPLAGCVELAGVIHVEAVPAAGYAFNVWRVENGSGVYTVHDPRFTFLLRSATLLHAAFRRTAVNWTQPDALLDVLASPWKYAVLWTEAWGGRMFIGSLITLASMVYVWWHTKEAVAAGLAGAICIAAIPVIPELRLAAYILLAFGSAAIIWRFLREAV